MEETSSAKQRKEPLRGLTLFMRSLVRLVLVVLVGICGGIILYFGGIILYQTLVAQPAGNQEARLDNLEALFAMQQTQDAGLLEQYNQRLLGLEESSAQADENISALQGDVELVKTSLEETNQNLERLDDIQAELDVLALDNVQTTQALGGIEETLESDDTPLAELQREVMVLRAMELLNRSRLYLMQNNAGLAGEDMDNARQTLEELHAVAPDDEKATVAAWIQRIDLALANLPTSPVLASDDLEIVWRMMVDGSSPQADAGTAESVFPPSHRPLHPRPHSA